MRVGVLVTGDTSVRAAHALSAHESVDDVVVIGPATSRSFEVVEGPAGCDYLIGSGQRALAKADGLDVPLIWDGDQGHDNVVVYGANPTGLTLAIAARETDPRLVAVAHAEMEGGNDQMASFPKPVGRLPAADAALNGKRVLQARSMNEFAACLVEGATRSVSIIDDGAFLAGVALAAGIACVSEGGPVWGSALLYLQAATAMGLVMAENV